MELEQSRLGLAHTFSRNKIALDVNRQDKPIIQSISLLELLDKETLGKEEVAKVFERLRRRPHRPAWTGSPSRVPSAIPPVEIPQEIRDRANGVPVAAGSSQQAPVGPPAISDPAEPGPSES